MTTFWGLILLTLAVCLGLLLGMPEERRRIFLDNGKSDDERASVLTWILLIALITTILMWIKNVWSL